MPRASRGLLWRLGAWARLIRLGSPAGWLLLLWPTLWALWLAAEGAPSPKWILVFVAGVFVMRCFGCVINDWADRKFDRQVRRTRGRPLAAGEIGVWDAAAVAAICLAAALGLFLALPAAARWWAAAALAAAIFYPFAKRAMRIPQLALGLAFSMGIPTAYAAAGGGAGIEALILALLNASWVLAYDTIYAMIDRDDDLRAGINSSAVFFGRWDALAASSCYAVFLCGMAFFGAWKGLGWSYYAGLFAGLGYAILLHRLYRRREDREACRIAFLRNHWLGAMIFAGVVAGQG